MSEARVDVIATLATSQDQVTWLAFSLAMTVETLLGIAYVGDIKTEHGRMLIASAGAFLGFVFLLLVMRSNKDMGILYKKGDNSFPYAFHLPVEERFGVKVGRQSYPSAGNVMLVSLLIWIIAWIVAFVIELL